MSVYKAINLVQSDLCKAGISKDSTNTFDGYKFRGIDAVYNALSPLLAKHGLCILPRVLSRSVAEHTSAKGGILFYVTVEAEFDFVCTEDGSKHTVKTFGEAMDRGDKATNKAMSAAYKYAAFQTFAIPTEGDNDADAQSHEVKSVKKDTPAASARGALKECYDKLSTDMQTVVKDLADFIQYKYKEGQEIAAFKAYTNGKAHDEDNPIDGYDNDMKMAVWYLLDANVRSGIKKIGEAAKSNQGAE